MKNAQWTSLEKKVLILSCLGMFLSTLDSGIINVALPTFQKEFQASVSMVSWTVTLYLLVLGTLILVFGKLSDRYGRLRIFRMGLGLFCLASLGCGVAQSIDGLIVARAFQGAGAAMLQATAPALMTTWVASERRNKAMGLLASVMGLGPILGPTLGGLLISMAGWRWIFWVNLPLCLAGLCVAFRLQKQEVLSSESIDFLGIALLAFAALCGVGAISAGQSQWAGYALVFALLLGWQQRSSSRTPFLPWAQFKTLSFCATVVGTIVFGCSVAMILIAPPFLLESFYGLSSWKVGLVCMSAPLGLILTSRWTGKHMAHRGEFFFMRWGFFLMLLSVTGLSVFSAAWHFLWLTPFLLLYGIGGGLFLPANISETMKLFPETMQGTVGAANRMIHNFGNAFGASMAAFFIQKAGTKNSGLWHGFHESWTMAQIGILVGCVLLLKGGRQKRRGSCDISRL